MVVSGGIIAVALTASRSKPTEREAAFGPVRAQDAGNQPSPAPAVATPPTTPPNPFATPPSVRPNPNAVTRPFDPPARRANSTTCSDR